jgi:glycosyltransferase 2 family protein
MRAREAFRALGRRRWVVVGLQLAAVAVLLGALGYAFRDAWEEAKPRLRHADLVDLGIALAILAAYYLLFTIAWQRILRAWGLRIPYFLALQAEMASILAKYIPGTVWIPAARVAALRRVGIRDTALILASVVLEAGLSAVAGVLIFFASLAALGVEDAPIVPLVAFTLVCAIGLHPRVFTPVARRVLRPFGASDFPPLPWRTLLGVMAFYAGTWLVGGTAVFFLLRSVGGDPEWTDIPFLAGVSAVAAIVAVLSIITPSGLGVREASMYGLLVAVVPEGVALGATILNRLAITIVELALLAVGAIAWRSGAGLRSPDSPEVQRTSGD